MNLHLPDYALPFYRTMNGTGRFDLHFYSLDTGDDDDLLRGQEWIRADGGYADVVSSAKYACRDSRASSNRR